MNVPFVIAFFALQGVICGYLYYVIGVKNELISENSSLKTTLESQKVQLTKEKLEYFENLQKSNNARIDRYTLDKTTCQNELESYKRLINAM